MVFRTRYWLAAALGLWMAHPLTAGEPARLGVAPNASSPSGLAVSNNQQIANTIAEQLRQSGHLRHYDINIVVRSGVAGLTGTVTDQMQHDEVLRLVQGVPGVERVRNRIRLAGLEPVTQAQAVLPNGPDLAPVPRRNENGGDNNGNSQGGPRGNGVEPTPIFQAAPSPSDMFPPKMPPNAWPTYAPYNNYARVAYPMLYPYNAWPFIGPMYPFPKVPLGWRKIKLQWQDGYWWYSKNATGHDWWRIRYW